jgi:anti-anti-sigma regulatory factor
MLSQLKLPAELTIYTVADFHARCVSEVLAPGKVPPIDGPCPLDASAVAEVDAAGLQSLVSLANALQRQGASLALLSPSEVLTEACHAIGMQSLLTDANPTGAAA